MQVSQVAAELRVILPERFYAVRNVSLQTNQASSWLPFRKKQIDGSKHKARIIKRKQERRNRKGLCAWHSTLYNVSCQLRMNISCEDVGEVILYWYRRDKMTREQTKKTRPGGRGKTERARLYIRQTPHVVLTDDFIY
jgi:hypothetical protein